MIKMEFSAWIDQPSSKFRVFFRQKKAPRPLASQPNLTFRKLYRRSAKGLEANLGSKHLDTLQLGTFMDGWQQWRKLMLWKKILSNRHTQNIRRRGRYMFHSFILFLNWWCTKKSWHVSGGAFLNQQKWRKGMNYFPSTSCNWLANPRYCQSKLAQVLKTRGYAQEAEQLLQRVVRGVMKLHSVT